MSITRKTVQTILAAACALAAAAVLADTPAIKPEQIEADWLRQDEVRNRSAAAVAVTAGQDAAGGVDGITNGNYGFHTNRQADPWWQVDLGKSLRLDRVVIYNRCDGGAETRALRLKVLLSPDGKTFRQAYQHDGTRFLGYPDKKPLVVPVEAAEARFVRIQLAATEYFHLDEVEVYASGNQQNIALGKPATQSSTSEWSARHYRGAAVADTYATAQVVRRGLKLAESLRLLGSRIEPQEETLRKVARRLEKLPANAPGQMRRELYLRARWTVRKMALANPLLDFDDLLFVKRVPGTFTHMSDQYLGWFSRPGGALMILKDFKSDRPRLECLTADFPAGDVLRPDISYDGRRVLFAWCKYYPKLRGEKNKLDKSRLPEDSFYHLFEISLDGSGLRQLTRGKYNDFDGRYLPDGRIVFLSTRRGHSVQYTKAAARATVGGAGPECYVRCGGDAARPCAVYTLHVIDAGGGNLESISPFEMFEWTPSIDNQGRILYARWDYVDRWNMPWMSLWSTLPDGTNARIVFGNHTPNPHCIFEARAIPGSQKLIFTASAHHAQTSGSLVLLDPAVGVDGDRPMRRLTPEVCFPETEGWPATYYANPYPLSEEHYLVAWSAAPLPRGTPRPRWGMPGEPNDLGIYLFDAFGTLNLLYRDPQITSMYPLPVRPRPLPHRVASTVDRDGDQEGRVLVVNVYEGLPSIKPGTIGRLRLVGLPVKTQPPPNQPRMSAAIGDANGKFVIGSVPVEQDGSAYFRAPSGVPFFLQALDSEGVAVQTMRGETYLQPGEKTTCIGCHEARNTAPPNVFPAAARREPSKITPGPEGSWPLSFAALVQPVMERHCVGCHRPGGKDPRFDLTAAKSYDRLMKYGRPSLIQHLAGRYRQSRSIAGAGAARVSPLVALLRKGHYEVKLAADDWQRLYTWMDTYAQLRGSFSDKQDEELRQLRQKMAPLLESGIR